jgi:methionyl-tRNA formyltransferase
VLEALARVAAGAARYEPQRAELATYCKKLAKEDGRVRWARPARELERLVRAVNPWPGASVRLAGGAELLLWRARAHAGAFGEPGTVLEAGQRWLVAAGEGALELLEVQAAGRRPLSAAEYLRGARIAPSARLEP